MKAGILDFKPPANVHFIGIGGIHMSALALILKNFGFNVSGSDIKSSKIVDNLVEKGIKVFIGHNENNVENADIIVFNAAIKQDNPEMIKAKEKNLLLIERPSLIGQIMKNYKYSLGIAGTHGKTTTTSMISTIFLEANLDPTILNGGELDIIGGSLRLGNSDFFIAEACEYVESFLKFYPYLGVMLNIDSDHLDYYKDINHISSAFLKYAKLIPSDGYLIANFDDARVMDVCSKVDCNIVSYGINNESSKYCAKNIFYNSGGYPVFEVFCDGANLGTITLSVPGIHNILNSLASIAASMSLGVSFEICKNALLKFKGAKRRFELKGNFNNVMVVDDYAHHPTEIKATLDAASKYPHNRLWCLFQPHTYTRTKSLLDEFAQAFDSADKIIVADIFAAREKDTGEVHSRDLVQRLKERGLDAEYIGGLDDISEYIKINAQPNDVVMTMGAGDIYKVGEEVIKEMNQG